MWKSGERQRCRLPKMRRTRHRANSARTESIFNSVGNFVCLRSYHAFLCLADDAQLFAKSFSSVETSVISSEHQTLLHHLRRAVEKFRRARDVVQGQFHPVDFRGAALVRPAIEFRLRHLRADGFHRLVDEMADDSARRREQFHPANLPGVFPDELHRAFGTRPHGQDGFSARAAGQHAFHRLHAAGGFGRVRQRGLRCLHNGLFGGEIAFASVVRAIAWLRRAVRAGDLDPLLADIHADLNQFLDGARAGSRVGLLQPVQHRADAERDISRRVQGGVHVRAANPFGVKRAGARADG
jgi:hypothetical protein